MTNRLVAYGVNFKNKNISNQSLICLRTTLHSNILFWSRLVHPLNSSREPRLSFIEVYYMQLTYSSEQ